MANANPIVEPDPGRAGCEAGQAALQRLLDGDPGWDSPEAAAHRVGCAECREELALARSFDRLAAPAVVPVGLTNRMLTASIAAHRRQRVVRLAAVGLALAASVVVVVFATRPGSEPPPDHGPSLAVVPAPVPDPVAPTPVKPLGESVSEVRDALVTLTRRTASEPRERFGQLLPNPKLPDGPDASEDLQPLADAGNGAARSVEPIRASARRAMNLFLRAADPPDRASQP